MKRHLLPLVLLVAAFFAACGRGDNPAPVSTGKDASAETPSQEPYLAWNDTVKAMGLRGDLEGAREVLKTFRDACRDKTASLDFDKNGEEANKTLYIAWGNVISFLFNQGEIVQAVDEVQAMQTYAEKNNDEFGTAMVEVTYGGLYTYSFDESIAHLRKALDFWEKSGNVPQMQYSLYMLSRELLGKAENTDSATIVDNIYADVLRNSDRMEKLDTANTYMKQVSEYQRLMVYVASEKGEEAKKSYDKVLLWWQKGEVVPQLRGMMANTMAQYLVKFGKPEEATPLIKEIDLPLFRLQTERKQALAMADYKRATELQAQIDKINLERINQLQQNQLAIANAAFNNLQLERENHQLELEKIAKGRILLFVCLISALLLTVTLWLLARQRIMRRKNLELVRRIKSQEERDDRNMAIAEMSVDKLSPREQLFLSIEKLLQNEKVLTHPELDRDMIASRLGTNRTYVAQAISECTGGKTVSGYINSQRVRLARHLLEKSHMTIDEIVYESGFSSRSHFHNLFTAQYGITPAQFRKTMRKASINELNTNGDD